MSVNQHFAFSAQISFTSRLDEQITVLTPVMINTVIFQSEKTLINSALDIFSNIIIYHNHIFAAQLN